MSFSAFDFHPTVAAGIEAAGFTEPTPIQERGIPAVLGGGDVLGLAQTGTGKTAAFVLPILQRLIDGPRKKLRALVLAPTRELAEQIHEDIRTLGQKTGLRSVTLYGGVAMNPQIDRLRRGSEIAVACPGRLLDHMERGNVDLSGIEVLVIDEADRMFDMGFLPPVRRILRDLPRNRQSLLFSATMPPDVRRLANDILRKPQTVEIDRQAPAATVTHATYPVAPRQKTELLLEFLRRTESGPVLVFTRTKRRAGRLGQQLQRAGHEATMLHGDLSQGQRQKALRGFRDGKFDVLVATDIAGRGIDVEGISHVVNYDMPDTVDGYIHRIGRTGRAKRDGDAITFVTPDDHAAVRAIERAVGAPLECRHLEGFRYIEAEPSSHGPSHSRGPGRRAPSPARAPLPGRSRPRKRARPVW